MIIEVVLGAIGITIIGLQLANRASKDAPSESKDAKHKDNKQFQSKGNGVYEHKGKQYRVVPPIDASNVSLASIYKYFEELGFTRTKGYTFPQKGQGVDHIFCNLTMFRAIYANDSYCSDPFYRHYRELDYTDTAWMKFGIDLRNVYKAIKQNERFWYFICKYNLHTTLTYYNICNDTEMTAAYQELYTVLSKVKSVDSHDLELVKNLVINVTRNKTSDTGNRIYDEMVKENSTEEQEPEIECILQSVEDITNQYLPTEPEEPKEEPVKQKDINDPKNWVTGLENKPKTPEFILSDVRLETWRHK